MALLKNERTLPVSMTNEQLNREVQIMSDKIDEFTLKVDSMADKLTNLDTDFRVEANKNEDSRAKVTSMSTKIDKLSEDMIRQSAAKDNTNKILDPLFKIGVTVAAAYIIYLLQLK
jgi:predicted RNase H-like nuclease (RuvC/YqgF family)